VTSSISILEGMKGGFNIRKEPLELARSKRLIILFLAVLAAVNLIMGYVYYLANPGKDLPVLVWDYFESSTFKIMITGLVIPFLLFYLERRVEIMDSIRKNRADRKRKRSEEKKERMWKCVEETSKVWNELFGLASEVIYFRRGAGEGNGKKQASIKDVLRRIRNFESTAENLVNMWAYRFPNLFPKKVKEEVGRFESHSVKSINVLLYATESVALSFQKSETTATDDTSDLQDSLRAIQDGIDGIAHHRILTILKRSIDLEDVDLKQKDRRRIESKIEEDMRSFRKWVGRLHRLESEHIPILPSIQVELIPGAEGESITAFRKWCKKLENWTRKNPRKEPHQYEGFKELKKAFYAIPGERSVRAAKIVYSARFVKILAMWLTFWRLCHIARKMALRPKSA
jgi:hypothetical protein